MCIECAQKLHTNMNVFHTPVMWKVSIDLLQLKKSLHTSEYVPPSVCVPLPWLSSTGSCLKETFFCLTVFVQTQVKKGGEPCQNTLGTIQHTVICRQAILSERVAMT